MMKTRCKTILLALPIGIAMLFFSLLFLELFGASERDREINVIVALVLMLGAIPIAQRILNRIRHS